MVPIEYLIIGTVAKLRISDTKEIVKTEEIIKKIYTYI